MSDIFKKYVIEPRNSDGSLNVKHYDPKEPKSFITGITEKEFCDYYFKESGDKSESQSMEVIYKWFNDKGLYIRRKTWY